MSDLLPTTATGGDLAQRMRYAEALAGARLLPGPYRRSPADVLLAVEYAAALGLSPVTALTSIHVVDGRPTMSAELMRALVLRAGHRFRVVESTATRCVVEVARADAPDVRSTFTWDTDDAHRAGLLPASDSSAWVRYPAAMLLARVTSTACRAVFPDVLAGVSYTPDELDAAATTVDVVPGHVVVDSAHDTGDSTSDVVDAELVDDATPDDAAGQRSGPPPRPGVMDRTRAEMGTPARHYAPSDGQLRAMNARCRGAGVRDVIHRGWTVAAVLDLPQPVESLRDLTQSQARLFLDATQDPQVLMGAVAATADRAHPDDMTDPSDEEPS